MFTKLHSLRLQIVPESLNFEADEVWDRKESHRDRTPACVPHLCNSNPHKLLVKPHRPQIKSSFRSYMSLLHFKTRTKDWKSCPGCPSSSPLPLSFSQRKGASQIFEIQKRSNSFAWMQSTHGNIFPSSTAGWSWTSNCSKPHEKGFIPETSEERQ